jgi:peptidoglycan hydrolase CwlO-like protein
MDGPVDLINKFTIDPLMEKTMGKHDTSQDGNIIVAINNRIESLKGEMQQMMNEVKYLRKEIGKISQNLQRGGK